MILTPACLAIVESINTNAVNCWRAEVELGLIEVGSSEEIAIHIYN